MRNSYLATGCVACCLAGCISGNQTVESETVTVTGVVATVDDLSVSHFTPSVSPPKDQPKPIAHAAVYFAANAEGTGLLSPTIHTDDNGRFSITIRTTPSYWFVVKHDGYMPLRTQHLNLYRDENRNIIVLLKKRSK